MRWMCAVFVMCAWCDPCWAQKSVFAELCAPKNKDTRWRIIETQTSADPVLAEGTGPTDIRLEGYLDRTLDFNGDEHLDLVYQDAENCGNDGACPTVLYANCGDDTFIPISGDDLYMDYADDVQLAPTGERVFNKMVWKDVWHVMIEPAMHLSSCREESRRRARFDGRYYQTVKATPLDNSQLTCPPSISESLDHLKTLDRSVALVAQPNAGKHAYHMSLTLSVPVQLAVIVKLSNRFEDNPSPSLKDGLLCSFAGRVEAEQHEDPEVPEEAYFDEVVFPVTCAWDLPPQADAYIEVVAVLEFENGEVLHASKPLSISRSNASKESSGIYMDVSKSDFSGHRVEIDTTW